MSLLGTQVFGNRTKPIWLGANGGTITGAFTVKAPNGEFLFEDVNGVAIGRLVAEVPSIPSPLPGEGIVYIQSDYAIAFYQQNNSFGNTILYTSSTAGEDVFVIGGLAQVRNLAISADPNEGMTGYAEIPVGQTNVVVPNTNIEAGDIILFTRPGAAAAGPGKGPGQGQVTYNPANIVVETSFQVDLVDPATGIVVAASDVNAGFQWVILRPFTP